VADHGDVAAYQLRALLDANRTIVTDLELEIVLRRIVESAVELVGADYGALAVVGEDGALEEFVHVGMDDGRVEAIGRMPERHGLLGLVVEEQRTIRADDITTHPGWTGFPEGHPPMRAFLGLPVRVRDDAFGNLYLARSEAEPFTGQDEEVVQALAATAGVAIENARLFEEARLRQEWLTASTEVTRRVLAGDEGALSLIAGRVHALAGSDLTSVVVPVDGELLVEVAEGDGATGIEGARYAASGTLSERVLDSGKPVRLTDAEDTTFLDGRTIYLTGQMRVGPLMVLPLLGREEVRGTLVVMREPNRRPFTQVDVEMATTFANHASVALELAEARRDQHRVLLLEDRARIARDLHDHVIQQVFAAGLLVRATAASLEDASAVTAMDDVIDTLDDAIKQIRVSIFQLQPPVPGGLRAAVMDVVADVRPGLSTDPRVDMDGPLDSVGTTDVVRDVTAVVREGLVNVARHAAASTVALSIHATTTRLTVTISDDGVGVRETGRRSGLDNMRERAERRNGSMVIAEVPDLGGTTLVWTVPIT
ncbi:MAG TPA: GAF domain-containing protein, partial [Nocardioides sp.]|nr:GAF domain-containing protein [Nocardioides sp.]